MHTALVVSALLMGLAAGPHCVVMCGPACSGLAAACGSASVRRPRTGLTIPIVAEGLPPIGPARRTTGDIGFTAIWHVGRGVGYASAGAVLAVTIDSLAWAGSAATWLKPLWTLSHALVLAWGLMLLVVARPPAFTSTAAKTLRSLIGKARYPWLLPFVIGTSWALIPCGMIYSALMLAAVSGSALSGAAVMAIFALGSGLSLAIAPIVLSYASRGRRLLSQSIGIRIAGAVLSGMAIWALHSDMTGSGLPWCA